MDLKTLKELNSKANSGRGVQVVRDIITLSERGMDATQTAIWDNDKIRNYPEIQTELRKLFPAYNAHLEKIEKMFG